MEEVIRRHTIAVGALLKVFYDEVRLPDGTTRRREVVEHPGSVGLIAIDAGRRVLLVRQYRHAVGAQLWEIPAGTREPAETPAQTAARELEEETGYRARLWKELGAVYLVPGWCTERMVFFQAEQLRRGSSKAASDEAILVGAYSLDELRALRARGEIRDAKTLLGLAWAGFDIWKDAAPAAGGVTG